jgi:hypothetical protein
MVDPSLSKVISTMENGQTLLLPQKRSLSGAASHKIEVNFGPKRTTNGPNIFSISVWESAGALNGEGDALSYFCLERDRGLLDEADAPEVASGVVSKGHGGCGGIIPDRNMKAGMGKCPSCNNIINLANATTHILGKLPTTDLAVKVAKLFRKLNNDCDIYVVYHPTDMRSVFTANATPEQTDTPRARRALTIYPLKNILTDTGNGASLESRFEALFKA